MNLFQEIKKNLIEILSESTAYGLPKMFKSKHIFFKIFWLAFILFGSIASIYFIIDSIQNYLKYEVIPKTEIIHQSQIIFPTITFCSSDKSFNKDLIDYCSFNKEEKNCKEYFQMYYATWYNAVAWYNSNCLQFNSGKNSSNHSIPILNSTGGIDNGLIISFKSNLSIDIWIDDPASISFINGVSFKKSSDYYLNYESFIYSEFLLSKTVEYKLGPPYNPCFIDNLNNFDLNKTIINYLHSNNVKYRQEYCEQLCLELEYINTNPCNCTNTSLGNVLRDCYQLQKNKDIQNCTSDYFTNYDMKNLDEKCKEYCPLECDSITYTSSIMKDKSTLSSSSSRIYIYFKDLKYTQYSEIPKTETFSFISEIGGILGLFIGCSFVTLFEFAEVLIEISFILFGRKHQISNQNSERTQNERSIELSFEETIIRFKNETNAKIEFLLKAIAMQNETKFVGQYDEEIKKSKN